MHEFTPPSSHISQFDVVIAGAGPVGLFLACEIRLAGLTVLVLEQAEDPCSPLKQPPFGMRGLSASTLEAFYRRGMLDDICAPQLASASSAAPSSSHGMQQGRRAGGHFAGIQFFLDDIDTSKWADRLPTPAPTNWPTSMQRVESVLTARAGALGVQIRRGVSVEDFDQSGDVVRIRCNNGETICTQWLVGCDGGRSIVRKKAGFDFVGTEPEFTGYSIRVDMADAQKLRPGRHYTATGVYTYQKPGVIAMVDFDGGAFHRTHPIELDHVQTVLRRVSGTDVTLRSLELATTWTDRAYQTTEYRKGRVLLAGDAAHIHSPLGGQGLNLGLGDAMNLGWKLAATIRGDCASDLLDTYTHERHPVGSSVLDWSRAQVALMRPSRSSRALEAIVRDVIETRDGATYFAERVWGVSLRYALGVGHRLVGGSVPDFAFLDGTKLGALMAKGKGVLLDFNADEPLRTTVSPWSDRIAYIAGGVSDSLDLRALLIRPDGIVAWATDTPNSLLGVAEAVARWFGRCQTYPKSGSP